MSQAQQSQNTKQDQTAPKTPTKAPESPALELEMPALMEAIGPMMAGGNQPLPPPDINNMNSKHLIAMQRLSGNQATSQFLSKHQPVQPKLTIGPVDDPYEREADQVADHVMRMPDSDAPAKQIRTMTAQRSSDNGGGGEAAEGGFEQAVSRRKSGGQLLPDRVRDTMEKRFGSDFSSVRVHADTEAQQLSKSIQAQAFTYGSDVYFGPGHFAPESDRGQRLLAHELTHVLQQTGSKPQTAQAQRQVIQRGSDGESALPVGTVYELKMKEIKHPKFDYIAVGLAATASIKNATAVEDTEGNSGGEFKRQKKLGKKGTNISAGFASLELGSLTEEDMPFLWPGFTLKSNLKVLEATLESDADQASIDLLKLTFTGEQAINSSNWAGIKANSVANTILPTSLFDAYFDAGYEIKVSVEIEINLDQALADLIKKRMMAKAKMEALKRLADERKVLDQSDKALREQMEKAKADVMKDAEARQKSATQAREKALHEKEAADKAKENRKTRRKATNDLRRADKKLARANKVVKGTEKAANKAAAEFQEKLAQNKVKREATEKALKEGGKDLAEKILKEELEAATKKASEKGIRRLGKAALKGIGKMATRLLPGIGWVMTALDVIEVGHAIYMLATGKATFGLGGDGGSGGTEPGGTGGEGDLDGGTTSGEAGEGDVGDDSGGTDGGTGGDGDMDGGGDGDGEGNGGPDDGSTVELTPSAQFVSDLIFGDIGVVLDDAQRQELNSLIPSDLTPEQLAELVKALSGGREKTKTAEEALEALRKNIDKINNPPATDHVEGKDKTEKIEKAEPVSHAQAGEKKKSKGKAGKKPKGNKKGSGGDGTSEGNTGPTAGEAKAEPTQEAPKTGTGEGPGGDGDADIPDAEYNFEDDEADKVTGDGGNADEGEALLEVDPSMAKFIADYKALAAAHNFYISYTRVKLKVGTTIPGEVVFTQEGKFFGGYITMKVTKSLGNDMYELSIPPFNAYDEEGKKSHRVTTTTKVVGLSEPDPVMENK